MLDFSAPQRQSKMGITILFFDSLQKMIRAFIAIFVVFAMNFEKYSSSLIWLGIGILVFSVLRTFLQYWYFTFQIDYATKELVIQKGFLKKSRISIQLHKIQQINLNQTLIHKVFQLYEVKVDTAGSGKKEVDIKAVSNFVANQFKDTIEALNQQESIVENKEIVQETNKKTIYIEFLTLVKTGITSKYVETFGWLFIVLNTLWENGKQIQIEDKIDTTKIETYFNFNSVLASVLFGLIFTFVLIITINLVRTIIQYFNFSITKSKSSLLLSFGLFTTKKTIINPIKVQLFKISQNYFQKKLDIQNLRIEQASSDEGNKQKKKDRIEIPGCSQIVKNQIFDFIYNKEIRNEKVFFPSIRKFWIRTIFMVVLPVIIACIGNFLFEIFSSNKVLLLASLYLVIGTLCCWSLYKNYQLKVTSQFISVQSGFWDIDTEIIEPYKIQAITTSQFFWQKRLNIGSVYVYTAGGNIAFTTGFYNEITQLCNEWLYQVETSNKRWM